MTAGQLDLLDGPLSQALRDHALDTLEDRYAIVLDYCRAAMRQLCYREGRPVHADDARAWIDQHPEGRQFLTGNMHWLGGLFRGKGWHPVGWHQSTVPGNHARAIRTWAWITP